MGSEIYTSWSESVQNYRIDLDETIGRQCIISPNIIRDPTNEPLQVGLLTIRSSRLSIEPETLS